MYGTIEIQRLIREKIIETDVKLEETDMELESLELANREMFETVNNLEKEVRSYTTPSLHSIHSEDLLCLSKIRQLAQEELNLKNCIRELEQKETIFKEHMDRLLASKEYQSVCSKRKIVSCVQGLDYSGKIHVPKCLLRKQRPAKEKQKQEEPAVSDAEISTSVQEIQKRDQETKPEVPQENKTEKKTSWIPNWFSNNQKSEGSKNATASGDPPHAENADSSNVKNEIEKPVIVEKEVKGDKPGTSLKSKSKSAQCHRPCITPEDLECILKKPTTRKHALPCIVPPCHVPPCHSHPCSKPFSKGCCPSRNPFEPPRYKMADHGMSGCQAYKLPCDPKGPCEICPSLPCSGYVRPGTCKCNCKGKCASGMSDVPCNCSDDPLGPSEEYRPIGSRRLADARREEDSDDDFCECCMCGCEDSDDSLCHCG
ncbi:uncharacterized protein LOC108630682 isoform X2 [Ceratina calcarata]|uniref:Uncharacterized protein LOC108630682 isoform X2 n=1 Tax=Ceratina calcarata TaxID=156304 RepID=A0AAJ7JBL4_9HYME|nr:uncharacterized protein LOC108630682 isoform X2 [Ceratina calcarata]